MTSPLTNTETFAAELRSSRIVNVYADSDEPYGVPELLLKEKSGFLYDEIEAPNEDDDEAYLTLTYPHGDLEVTPSDDACLVILCWIMIGKLPDDFTNAGAMSETHLDSLVHCWCMGEAWEMPQFQDAVMLALLEFFEAKITIGSQCLISVVKLAFENSTPESKLRRLLLEELINAVHVDETMTVGGLETFDGIGGFITEFSLARERLGGKRDRFSGRLDKDTEAWKEWMANDGR